MNQPSATNVAPQRQNEGAVAFRVLGILAIALGTLQTSVLVVTGFPPPARLAGGIYFGIVMGLLGIPVFLLVRWAVIIFVIIWIGIGLMLMYAGIAALSASWAYLIFVIANAAANIVMPVVVLRSGWSALR